MSRSKKKAIIVAAMVICVFGASGAAIAYWTSTGSGSVAATASSGGTVTLSGSVAAGIAPGLSKVVSLTASNPTSSAVMVGVVSLTGVTVDGGHAGCVVADFTMANVTENQSIAAGGTNVALANDGSLVMANTGVNQDACKGATLTLALASS